MVSVVDVLVLSQVPNIGTNRLRNLITHFRGTPEIVSAPAREFAAVEGFSKKLAAATAHFFRSPSLDRARQYAHQQLSRLNKAGGSVVTYWDDAYPGHLKKIYDPPPFFFMRGTLEEADRYALAIVGTRRPTEYGIALAEHFSREFVRLGIVVVSGLARGVDTAAHTAAANNGGRTIAVIGSGIDVIYPRENTALSARIAECGAVISEYAMGAKPDAVNFPRRNRLISGLSLGTLVIETGAEGGAMITANMALDQNREVFAVPGNITSAHSRGCNLLIKEGKAKLVECVDDVTAELTSKLWPRPQNTVPAPPQSLSFFEKSVYDVTSETPLHLDRIAGRLELSPADVLVNLLSLQRKGLVKQMPGRVFMRN